MQFKSNRIVFDNNLNCYRGYFNDSDKYFMFDKEDIDLVSSYTWYYENSTGYVRTTTWDIDTKQSTHITLHRLIMSKYYNIDGMVIDHMNHNKLDNRKFNLRICTNKENQRNIRSPISNTGLRGISYEKDRNKYRLTIKYKGKKYRWRFNTAEEAVKQREAFYLEHPDEFRYNDNEGYINRNNPNVIHPFVFLNHDNNVEETELWQNK